MWNQLRLIGALLVLLSASGAVFAQTQLPGNIGGQFDPSPALGPPTVVVTEVKNLGVSGNNLRIRVKWNAQVPGTTKVEKFKVLLAVNYTSGDPALPNQDVTAATREAILLVPNRGASNPPKSFRTFIQAFFTTIVAQSTTFGGSFKLDKSNKFIGGEKLNQGSSAVGKVAAANNGTDFSKIDADWAFTLPPQPFGANEVQFRVQGDFVYRGVATNQQTTINRSATLTAGAGARQVQFSFPSTPKFTAGFALADITANINVKAFFTVTQRNQSAPLEGNL